MNRIFADKHENFRKVFLFLCPLNKIDEYADNLRKHGFKDIVNYSFKDIDDRMYNIKYHPHIVLFDETLYPGESFDMRRDSTDANIIRYDMDKNYGFIRCFIYDPLCFWAVAHLQEDGTQDDYEALYNRASNIRLSYHSIQEIDRIENDYECSQSHTEEEKDEDISLYLELFV